MSKERDLLIKILFDKALAKRDEEPNIECCLDKIIKNRDNLTDIKPTSGFNAG